MRTVERSRWRRFLPSRLGRFRETFEWFRPIAHIAPHRLSLNLFPNIFSRNCPTDMEKRDAPQTSKYQRLRNNLCD